MLRHDIRVMKSARSDAEPAELVDLLDATAATPEQLVIEKILAELGLQARAPPRAPARGQALQAV